MRDQIHSRDFEVAFEACIAARRPGAVYNFGGRRESNASVLECRDKLESGLGRPITTRCVEDNRKPDHL